MALFSSSKISITEIINSLTNKQKIKWQWLNSIISNKKENIEKIVIVIDNIDRCHKDLAFELLLTIKNFLEQKNVIFIIPIDESEIKKHIEKCGNDPNEFIRKLFNTTIYIKRISEGDLFDFAKTLNKEYKLGFPVEVISIISQEFSKNPRKIIQFLNVLQTELLLANFQEGRKIIPNKSITDNLAFFTKLLIIREEWPDIYNNLKETPILIKDLHQIQQISDIKLKDEQIRFFRRTEHIKPNHTNYELFFNTKDSFRDIPDITNKLVESNDFESIEQQIENKELTGSKLIEFIDTKFEKAIRRGEFKTTIVNILNLLFQLSLDSILKEDINNLLYGKGKFLGNFKNFINSSNIQKIILDLDSKLLLNFIKNNNSLTSHLKPTVIETINNENKSKQLLIQYIRTFQESPKDYKQISPKFISLIKEDFNFINEIEDILSNHEVVKNLINSNLTDQFINEISVNVDDDENIYKVKIISILTKSNGLSNKQYENYLIKVLSFIKNINDLKTLPFWLKELSILLKFTNDDEITTNIHNTLQAKHDYFWSTYNLAWNNSIYQESLLILTNSIKELYYVTNISSQSDQQITWLNNFFSRNESHKIIQYINTLYKDIINHFEVYNWPFSQKVIERFTQVSDWDTKIEIASTINLMLSITTKDNGLNQNQISKIFRNYINLINGENKETIIQWLSTILKNPVLIESFKTEVNKLSSDVKLDIIGVLNKLGASEIIEVIINETLDEADYDELVEVFNKLREAEISQEAIRKSIKIVLKELDKNDYNFTGLIEFLSTESISDNVIHNLIAEKIKHLLVSHNKEDILFAIKTIDKIKISDSRKKEAIRILIQDINKETFTEEDDLKLLNRVEKKLK